MTIRFYSLIVFMLMFPVQSNSRPLPAGRGQSAGFKNGYISVLSTYSPSFMYDLSGYLKSFGLDEADKNYLSYGFELHGFFNPALGIGIKYLRGGQVQRKIGTVEYQYCCVENDIKLDRSVESAFSRFGLSLSYRKVLAGKLEFFGAFGASYGRPSIIISQDYGDQTFEEMWDSFDPGSGLLSRYNRSVKYTTGVYVFEAENGVRFFASPRVAAGASVGYIYGMFSDKSEINYGFESVRNVPDLDISGLIYRATIYFGY